MKVFFSKTQNGRRRQGLALVCLFVSLAFTTTRAQTEPTKRIQRLMEEVRLSSFPELQGVAIQIRFFSSESDYLQARFTIASFLWQRTLLYVLHVNRQLFTQPPPEAALRAILAHELGHLLYYQSHCRPQLLLLARLGLPAYAAGFERATDLLAIERGYGNGLKAYREWLYQQIPPRKLQEKQRNYFSPVEIDALLRGIQAQPTLLQRWRKHPPRSLAEIERSGI